MFESLKNDWNQLLTEESISTESADKTWLILEKEYRKKTRAYHNFGHLQHMFSKLRPFENQTEDLAVIKFSIWFHDLIYKVTRKDNELKSANFAGKALEEFGFEKSRIQRCFDQIVSTKLHLPQGDFKSFDEKLLIDLDLDVLSWDWDNYINYTRQIRQEYRIYPSFLYRKGRLNAMKKFLDRKQIYFTDFYISEKESIARKNLMREIEILSKEQPH